MCGDNEDYKLAEPVLEIYPRFVELETPAPGRKQNVQSNSHSSSC